MKMKKALILAAVLSCITIIGCTSPKQTSNQPVKKEANQTEQQNVANAGQKDTSSSLLKQELKVRKVEQPISVKLYKNNDGSSFKKIIFITSETCPHCQEMKPYIKQYMKANPDAVLYEMNSKNQAEMGPLFIKYNVEAYPTIIAANEYNEPIEKTQGKMDLKQINDFVETVKNQKPMIIDKEYGIEFIYSPDIEGIQPEIPQIEKFVDKQRDKFTVFKTTKFDNKVLFRAQAVGADLMPLAMIYDKDFNVVKIIEGIRVSNMEEAQKEIDKVLK